MEEDKLKLFFCRYKIKNITINLSHIDILTNRRFLVIDTGATISLFPHKSNNKPSSLQLTAANGQPISSWGDRWILLQFGNRRFEWSFHLADVAQPLLGADFF